MPKQGGCRLYDAYFDRSESVKKQEEKNGSRVFVTIRPLHSVFLLFGETADKEEQEQKPFIARQSVPVSGHWSRSLCKSADYPDGFGEKKSVAVPDALEAEQPEFSGIAAYERDFEEEALGGRPVLIITDAYEGVELFVNGKSLGIQIVPPFRYDLTDAVRPGKNRVRIEVATTLEREMAKHPDPIRMYLGLGQKVPVCPSGINGEILLERETEKKNAFT